MHLRLDDDLETFATSERVRSRGFSTPGHYIAHLIRQDLEMDRIRRFLAGDAAESSGAELDHPGHALRRWAEKVRRW